GAIIGFMTLQADGYIDFAYVAPDHIGQGIAKQLYDRTTAEAREIGVQRLYSEASYPARRFFERRGWSVVKEQTITRRDVSMTNFLMEKYLTE
ncbi:MAG: GNAT family N-acetyltransferase, partial [Hyphomicrobium sp.]